MSQGSAAATVVAALRPPPGALGAALRASEQRPPGALGRAPGGRPLLPLAPTTARGAAWGAAPSLRQRMCPAPCAARGPGSSSRGAGSGHQWSETERAEDPSESDTAADEEGSPVVVDLGSILSIREQEEGGALGSLDEEDPPHLKGFVRGSLGGGKLEERWLQRCPPPHAPVLGARPAPDSAGITLPPHTPYFDALESCPCPQSATPEAAGLAGA
mmetsp:Transcript_58036/g.184417  ORF Transcript_58036/g.184417 Transcript_58036/m.184417 type:complete len:216 (+) Transcript_58036:323-970(+)